MARNLDVTHFIDSMAHARKVEISRLRVAILGSDPDISEKVKWNAPSFCWKGEDRATMRLQPGDRLQIILHRGVKPKDSSGFAFDDPTGMIEWAAIDRGVITIVDAGWLDRKKDDVVKLVNSWMKTVN